MLHVNIEKQVIKTVIRLQSMFSKKMCLQPFPEGISELACVWGERLFYNCAVRKEKELKRNVLQLGQTRILEKQARPGRVGRGSS